MSNLPLRIGVLGAGHLGKIHLKCIQSGGAWQLAGFYDPDPQSAAAAAEATGATAFPTREALFAATDAIDIVTPTTAHHEAARAALQAGKHVFIEKPVTTTLEQAEDLLALAATANRTVQVGHVERFNPAFLAAQKEGIQPLFIEAHRMAMFNPRGTDVSIVLDLMIHDIDIVLHLVPSELIAVSASGVAVVSETPDIANARLEFANGCVANLTASRISLKAMRKMRLFQPDSYLAIDFLKKKTDRFRLSNPGENHLPMAMEIDLGGAKGHKVISFEQGKVDDVNAIELELKCFAEAIRTNTPPPVTLRDGYEALRVAHWVLADMERKRQMSPLATQIPA